MTRWEEEKTKHVSPPTEQRTPPNDTHCLVRTVVLPGISHDEVLRE